MVRRRRQLLGISSLGLGLALGIVTHQAPTAALGACGILAAIAVALLQQTIP